MSFSSAIEQDSVTTLISKGQPLGTRLAQAREARQMSQADLALQLGVDLASVQAWESGERDPRANRIVILAGILGVSIGWLIDGSEDETLSKPSNFDTDFLELRQLLEQANTVMNRLERHRT